MPLSDPTAPCDDPRAGRVRYEEFGLESVLRAHNPFIKTKSDVCLMWLHYVCLRNLMKSHGGEGSIIEERTESLPRNLTWNGLIQRYLIKYEFRYATYVLGVYIRKDEADCSLVTLEKSLRIGIPISELVRDDLTMIDSATDNFTEVVEREFIQPMLSTGRIKDALYGETQSIDDSLPSISAGALEMAQKDIPNFESNIPVEKAVQYDPNMVKVNDVNPPDMTFAVPEKYPEGTRGKDIGIKAV